MPRGMLTRGKGCGRRYPPFPEPKEQIDELGDGGFTWYAGIWGVQGHWSRGGTAAKDRCVRVWTRFVK